MRAEIVLRRTKFEGVLTDSERLFTKNLVPSARVYGERLYDYRGEEYREWVPSRSKLAAYLKLGGKTFPFREGSKVLYLGAASGTTASHISDILAEGRVYCVEISPRSFRDLVAVCERRGNMVPILGDAARPEDYSLVMEDVDVVYQDVAQKNQVSMFLKNMRAFEAGDGMIAIKARSEDVARPPKEIFEEAERKLRREGLRVVENLPLDPLEKDHAMIVVSMK